MLSPNAISEAAVAEAIMKAGCKRHLEFDHSNNNHNTTKNDEDTDHDVSTTSSEDDALIRTLDSSKNNISNETSRLNTKKQRRNDTVADNTNNDHEHDRQDDNDKNKLSTTSSEENISDSSNTNDPLRNKNDTPTHRAKNGKISSSSIEKAMNQIHEIWKNKKTSTNIDCHSSNDEINHINDALSFPDNAEDVDCHSDMNSIENAEKINQTKQVVFTQFENIIRLGMEAFHRNDTLNRELIQAKETNKSQKREIERMRLSEDDTRASLSNLVQAVEASKSNARDSSRAAQTETRLRGEITSIRHERDVALGTKAELQRRTNLLEEEVRMLKSRVGRLTQDKIKIERESRAVLGLARSMDSHVASDVEFYRRKVTDLNDHLQSKNQVITELKEEVESYKRDMQRSLSQNRLAQIRRSESRKR